VDIDAEGDMDLFMVGWERSGYGSHLSTRYFENTGNDHLQFTDAVEGPLHYQILSIDGRSVQNGELQNQSSFNQFIIHSESLHPGYYLLKIKSKKQTYISNFLKR